MTPDITANDLVTIPGPDMLASAPAGAADPDREKTLAVLADIFPDLAVDAIAARLEQYQTSANINEVIDDLMAYCHEQQIMSAFDDIKEEDETAQNEQILAEMFPSFDANRRRRILDCVEGDFERAAPIMIELADENLSTFSENVRTLSCLFPLLPAIALQEALAERSYSVDRVINDLLADEAVSAPATTLNMANHFKLHAFKRMFPSATDDVIREVMETEKFLYLESRNALIVLFGDPCSETKQTTRSSARQLSSGRRMEHFSRPRVVQPFSVEITAGLDQLYRGDIITVVASEIAKEEQVITSLSAERNQVQNRARTAIDNRQHFHAQILYGRCQALNDQIQEAREKIMLFLFIVCLHRAAPHLLDCLAEEQSHSTQAQFH